MHQTHDFTERIWQLVQGKADAEVEVHLETCPDCQELQQSLEALFTLRLAGGVPPVPNTVISSLNGLMQKVRPDLGPRRPSGEVILQKARTIFAELIHDTKLQPQVVGLRGDSDTRQIAFVSDVADLDLEVSETDSQFLVVGQLGMDEVPDNLSVRFVPAESDPLEPNGEASQSIAVSQQGYFRLTIDPGDWVVAVDIDDAVVLFPGVKL